LLLRGVAAFRNVAFELSNFALLLGQLWQVQSAFPWKLLVRTSGNADLDESLHRNQGQIFSG
jgi:hypothetical protein